MRVQLTQDSMIKVKAGTVVDLTADQLKFLRGKYKPVIEERAKTAPKSGEKERKK